MYKRNAAGLPTKRRTDWMTTRYAIKGGKVVVARSTNKGGERSVERYGYDEEGRVNAYKLRVEYTASDVTHVQEHDVAYAFDKRGNLAKTTHGDGSVINKYKNTYKNGRLVKVKSDDVSYMYRYKAITVPKSMVAKVRAQQWAIFNGGRCKSFVF